MPRPKGLGRGEVVSTFYVWVVFLVVCALGLFAFVALATAQEPNRAAKGDFQGKSYHRICQLKEADQIERLSSDPKAKLQRYRGDQAIQYRYILATGNRLDGSNRKLPYYIFTMRGLTERTFGGIGPNVPTGDKIYILHSTEKASFVYPFFVSGGCVVKSFIQIPMLVHIAIVSELEGRAT